MADFERAQSNRSFVVNGSASHLIISVNLSFDVLCSLFMRFFFDPVLQLRLSNQQSCQIKGKVKIMTPRKPDTFQ